MSSSVSHRFLKCSIKWDVLTFCFSPVSASLLHSFYSLENTTLSLAYFYSRLLPARRYAPQFSTHGPEGPCLMAFLAPDAWDSWLYCNVHWWACYSPDGGGCNLACTRRGTRFWTCHWLLLPPLPHLCDLFIDHVEFHESARRISGLGTRCRGSRHWFWAYVWHAPFCVWSWWSQHTVSLAAHVRHCRRFVWHLLWSRFDITVFLPQITWATLVLVWPRRPHAFARILLHFFLCHSYFPFPAVLSPK